MADASRILLVDDDPAVLDVCCEVLRTDGYDVLRASNGAEGLRVTRDQRPEVVLLDVMLPDVSGLEVCRQIKREPNLKDVFVVLFSGMAAGPAEKVNGLVAGADEYLVKPLDPNELLARVRTVLRLRQTTAALRASEQHCRRLIEILPDAMAFIDGAGHLLDANSQAGAMFNSLNHEELLAKTLFDLAPREEHERLRTDIANALNSGTMRNARYTLLRTGGSPFPAEISATAATEAQGMRTGLVLIIRNVSERKAFEKALTSSVQALGNNMRFLETLVDAIPYPVFYKDATARYQGCNRAFERQLGLSKEQLRGKTVYDIMPAEHAARHDEVDRELLAEPGIQAYESLVLYADGLQHEVILNKATFLDAEGRVAGLVGTIVDLTELRRAEEQIRLLADAVHSTAEMICVTDEEDRFVFVNRAFQQAYGYAESEVLGKTSDILLSPNQPTGLHKEILERTRSGGWRGEVLDRRKDGSEFPVFLSTSQIKDPEGRVLGLMGVAQDISTRKHAEAVLRESEEKFRTLFESAPIGIALHDADGHYVHANQAYQQMLGYSADELRRLGTKGVTHPEDVPEGRRLYGELRAGTRDRYQREKRYLRKDGRVVWAQSSASAIRNDRGQVAFIVSMVEDITRRKEAVDALNVSERRLRLIAENTTDVIFAFDMNRQPAYINPAVEKLTGYTLAEIQAKKFINWIHPEDQERMLKHWEELYEGKGYSEVEFRLITKHGEIKWCSSTWGPLLDENGRQIGVQGRERDITALKRAEKQKAALSQLGYRLSAASDPEQAARIIFDVASELFAWDAGHLVLYSADEDRIVPVLAFDTVDGQRIPFPATTLPLTPTPLMCLVIQNGAKLIRGPDELPQAKRVPFGKGDQRSACSMFVPIGASGTVMGILTLQSYQPEAYAQEDLILLQTLADHCAGALRRIAVTEALRRAEDKYRSIVENATEGIFQTTPQGGFLSANPALARMLGYESPEDLVSTVVDLAGQVYVMPEQREEFKRLMEQQGVVQAFEFEHYRKDRSIIWVSVNARAVRDAGGEVLYYEGTLQDITKRKQAEEALEMSQILQAALLDNMPDPAWLKDAEGRYLACNEPLARFLGQTREQIVGRTLSDLAPQEAAQLAGREKKVLQTGKPVRFEVRRLDAQGHVQWFETIESPLLNERGAATGTVGISRDITERKWAENLLRVQLGFGIFLSSTNDLAAAADRLLQIALENEELDVGAVYLVNPQTGALDLTTSQGLSAGFAKHASHFDADIAGDASSGPGPGTPPPRPRTAGPMARILEQLERESLLAMEVAPIQHAGEVVAVLIVGSRVQSAIPLTTRHGIEALGAQAGGALARIRAEQSMRANRQLLEKTLDSIHAAVFILDADAGTITECNPAATRMFGYASEEMLGQMPRILHPDDATVKAFGDWLKAAGGTQTSASEFELRMRRKDGTCFDSEHSVAPLRDDAGRVQRWVDVVRDITDRKRTERELREVSRRIIEAQEGERLRVARELHDGVNQIIASAKMRLRKVQDTMAGLGPAGREILGRCDQLLVQALEENRRIAHNLRPSELDALGLASACRNFCKDVQSRTDLTVKCSLTRHADQLPPAMQLNLFRIVQEAINNAEKYAHAKNVRLQIGFRGKFLVLKVRDDGRGFDPKAPKAAKHKRSGIGLTNISERTASLGGTCVIKSAPGQGTILTVSVPCERPDWGARVR